MRLLTSLHWWNIKTHRSTQNISYKLKLKLKYSGFVQCNMLHHYFIPPKYRMKLYQDRCHLKYHISGKRIIIFSNSQHQHIVYTISTLSNFQLQQLRTTTLKQHLNFYFKVQHFYIPGWCQLHHQNINQYIVLYVHGHNANFCLQTLELKNLEMQ